MIRHILVTITALLVLSAGLRSVEATWSIVVCDQRTKEVGIASVTCLTSFDLLAATPVVRVGLGAAAVQAAGDADGTRRGYLSSGLSIGLDPALMISILGNYPGHTQRQYGIVDTRGRRRTFTGSQNMAWAGGFSGINGDLAYAVQGNILAGPCVLTDVEAAITTPGLDLPSRLMAGMQVARDAGGDGRCSCLTGPADSCGCPPAAFTKSGHIGYFVIARIGDIDDPICTAAGCADGDYLYTLNVPFQSVGSLDPVDQLQSLFANRRADLAGRPDAVFSQTSFTKTPNGRTLRVELRDFDDLPVSIPATVLVEHAAASDGASQIGTVLDLGNGVFEVEITDNVETGIDQLSVTVDDGFRPVTLMPPPASYCAGSVADGAADCNGNGVADLCDLAAGTSEDLDGDGDLDDCPRFSRGDCDGSGVRDLADPVVLLNYLFVSGSQTPSCREACNADGGTTLDLGDAITLLTSLFSGGPAFPPPYPGCGVDPDPITIDCVSGGLCP